MLWEATMHNSCIRKGVLTTMDKNEKFLRSFDKKLSDILSELKKINRQNDKPTITFNITSEVKDLNDVGKIFERLTTSEYL
jgi:(p)ppGpp synthase/HD superfamily hydrolase